MLEWKWFKILNFFWYKFWNFIVGGLFVVFILFLGVKYLYLFLFDNENEIVLCIGLIIVKSGYYGNYFKKLWFFKNYFFKVYKLYL